MEWYDERLKMQNLKDDIQLNVLANEERSEIWIPNIIFGNNDENQRFVLDEKVSLVVRREENGTANDYTDLDAAETFLGSENPLIYTRTYSTKFECNFDLRRYPFDAQECFMELATPAELQNKVKLVVKAIKQNPSHNFFGKACTEIYRTSNFQQ